MIDSTNDARQHIAELVSKAKVGMLTTTTAEGKQVSQDFRRLRRVLGGTQQHRGLCARRRPGGRHEEPR